MLLNQGVTLLHAAPADARLVIENSANAVLWQLRVGTGSSTQAAKLCLLKTGLQIQLENGTVLWEKPPLPPPSGGCGCGGTTRVLEAYAAYIQVGTLRDV